MSEERRVHVYASGRGFVVVPVCYQSDGEWVESEPVQSVSLTRGLPHAALLGRAMDEALVHPCDDPQPWTDPRRRREHNLFVARLTRHPKALQLSVLPDAEPIAEWPGDYAAEPAARRLLARLGEALR